MRFKLGILFFLFSIIPLMLLGGFSAWRTRTALEEQAAMFSRNLLAVTAIRLESAVDSLLYASRTISVDSEAKQLMQDLRERPRDLEMIRQEQALHARLNSVRVQNPRIRTIILIPQQGAAVINGVPTSFESSYFRNRFRETPLFQRVVNGRGTPRWLLGVEGRYDRIYLLQRMIDPLSGDVLGLLAIGMDRSSFVQMFREARGRTGGELLLVDPEERIFAAVPDDLIGIRLDSEGYTAASAMHDNRFIEFSATVASAWSLVHRVPESYLTEGVNQLLYGLLALSLLLVLLAFVLAALLPRMFSRPVTMLLDAMQQSGGGEFLPVHERSDDEFARLFAGYNQMVRDLQRLFQQQQDNLVTIEEQKQTIEEHSLHLEGLVQERTRELVESEKMASLGGLVVGVSHEINTPVGTGITAVSIIQETLEEIHTQFQSGSLTRAELDSFFATAQQSAGLALHNLQRASELISSFKRVAVNQSIEERVRFQLQETLRDIAHSLQPRIDAAGQEVIIDCPFEIELFSYPGVLYQVVVNLINNAMQHAYRDASSPGQIRVHAELVNEHLLLQCSDDGCGMSPETAERVFDPFFTTARGHGGTGLGLHIVYNLVTQKLGGRIAVESALGRGSTVTIRVPLQEIVAKSTAISNT